MNYYEIIQTPGRRFKKNIKYYIDDVENTLLISDFVMAKLKFNASLIGTVMKSLELETKVPIKGTIYLEITAYLDTENQDTKIYGPYYLKEKPTYNADTKTYTHICYDEFIKTMVDYKPLEIEYPTTVLDFFKQLCKECGYTTDIEKLPNGSKIMKNDIYDGINFTYRDVFDDIAQATATLFQIDGSVIKKCNFIEDNVAKIDDSILKNKNISFGEHFGPINSIVLSRSADSDKIYKRDETLTEWNEFVIKDNQLMNENNRDEFLSELYDALYGIGYDIYDTELTGYGGFIPLQKIIFETNNKTYNSFVFNNEVELKQGYKEVIYADMPNEYEMDYKTSDTTDKRINQAYIIVRKQEKEIEALASSVVDLIDTKHAEGILEMTSSNETTAFELKIRNACEVFSHNKLFSSDDLHGKDSWLKITYEDGTFNRYQLPTLALRQFNGVYDELNIKSSKVSITKRISVNENNEYSLLPKEITTDYEDIPILIKEGKNIFELESFPNAVFDIRYMIDSILNGTFMTNEQVTSLLDITAGQIRNEVSSVQTNVDNNYQDLIKQLDDYVTNKNLEEFKKSVETTQTSTDYNIQILEEKLNNGVKEVTTENNYRFSKDGLQISEEGAPTGLTINESGQEVVDKTGSDEKTLQYNGYVTEEIAEKTPLLEDYKGQTVNYSKNLIFEEYLTSPNFRIEEYEDENHGTCLGVFFTGRGDS